MRLRRRIFLRLAIVGLIPVPRPLDLLGRYGRPKVPRIRSPSPNRYEQETVAIVNESPAEGVHESCGSIMLLFAFISSLLDLLLKYLFAVFMFLTYFPIWQITTHASFRNILGPLFLGPLFWNIESAPLRCSFDQLGQ